MGQHLSSFVPRLSVKSLELFRLQASRAGGSSIIPAALHLLNDLLALSSDDVHGNLSANGRRLLKGTVLSEGMADLERAIVFAPQSSDVRFIVADAHT